MSNATIELDKDQIETLQKLLRRNIAHHEREHERAIMMRNLSYAKTIENNIIHLYSILHKLDVDVRKLFKQRKCVRCSTTKDLVEAKDVIGGDDWNWWCKKCLAELLSPKPMS